MNKVTFRRNYKYIALFLFLILISFIFSDTRIISYNFGRYTTELEIKKNNIINNISVFDENIFHNVSIKISEEDYKNLILYYIQNEEKQYIKTDIIIDGKEIKNVGLRLKGSKLLRQSIDDININNVDFSFFIKFDKYDLEQTYSGLSEISIISGTIDDLKGEHIALKIFNNFGIISPESSFASVKIGDYINETYLLKESVNSDFLTQKYNDDLGLLYKGENSMSFTYLGEDPTAYTDLFSQKTLENNYDLKKLIEVLNFISNSDDDEIKLNLNKYINTQNYAKFLAINNYLYKDNKKIKLLDSYYMYFDLSSETIKFIPWDSKYIYNLKETSVYSILDKFYSKQEIIELSKKDIRELLGTITNTIPSDLKSKFKNDLEDIFLDKNIFKESYKEIETQIINQIENSNFIENLEINMDKILNP